MLGKRSLLIKVMEALRGGRGGKDQLKGATFVLLAGRLRDWQRDWLAGKLT